MASGVINGHLYVAGGRDAADEVINLTWEYDIEADTWTLKANMPGTQNNVRGSAVALERLWAFGGGNPFGPTYQGLTKDASARPLNQAAIKDNPLVPLATNDTVVYDPMGDSWSSAAPNEHAAPIHIGTAIGAKLIAAGGGSPFVPSTASVEALDASSQRRHQHLAPGTTSP